MADFLHTTPPATTIRTQVEDINDEIGHTQRQLASTTNNISQVLQRQNHFHDRYEKQYLRNLVKKENKFTRELSGLKKRKRDIMDPTVNTKPSPFAPKHTPSRVRSLSHSRSNKNKKTKVQLLRSSSLGGTKKKRRTRTRK